MQGWKKGRPTSRQAATKQTSERGSKRWRKLTTDIVSCLFFPYGESMGKTWRVFVFVFVLFLLGFGVHHLFIDKIRAAWIDHRRLVVSFFFEL
jgi:hypothetical protein